MALSPRTPQRTSWGHDRLPLVVSMLAAVALLSVLPSALNIPQSTPSETLEYAPVPPDDQNQTNLSGNFSSLGLGSSSGLRAGAIGTSDAGAAGGLGGRAVKTPSTKRCVGDPPRQTEDPLSPPCVSYFSGDNFGATYQGVTREEVRVLVYVEGRDGCRQSGTSRPGRECTPHGQTLDLGEPEQDNEEVYARMLRLYQRYFNERYQTYNRFVRFFVYYSTTNSTPTPESRRAEAAQNFKHRPFAVINMGTWGYGDIYTEEMAARSVITFLSSQNERNFAGHEASFFASYPRFVWSVASAIEEQAELFTSLVCRQVAGRPVSFSGMAGDLGQPRRLGLVVPSHTQWPNLRRLAELVKPGVEACGGQFVAEALDDGTEGVVAAAAKFRQENVTTIVWPAGPAYSGFSTAAAAINYYPEVVFSGSGASEWTFMGQTQAQSFWRNAIGSTARTRADVLAARPCVQAGREVDPDAPGRDLANFGCIFYDALRLLFTGIQVAGPRLDPPSVDKGFRAIPAIASADPRVPACFFRPGDYTCVKDAMVEWWDPAGRDPNSAGSPGCYRMMRGGQRFLVGTWPKEDVAASRRPDDPCNSQGLVPA